MSFIKTKHFYLLLAIIGTILTLWQLSLFSLQNGLNIVLMFSELFKNNATSFFGFDLIVTAVTVIFFIIFDGKRLKIKHLWLPLISIFLVGVALGFPLYLYIREIQIEKRNLVN
jgi:CDP-diglyceride synthetase